MTRWRRNLLLVLTALVLLAGSAQPTAGREIRASAASPAKGSSCAHPYEVQWNVPSPRARNIPGVNPGEFYGDTRYLRVREKVDIEAATKGIDYFLASWTPRVSGLHVCEARIAFAKRKAVVSHQWHRTPIRIAQNPQIYDPITSFVVTAAR